MSNKAPQTTAAGKTKAGIAADQKATTRKAARKTGRHAGPEVPVHHIGLDVHAADFTAAIADPGRDGEVRELGTFSSDLHALEKLIARLRKAHPGARLHVAYEAGPTGFVFARRLAQIGAACTVAAPSLMPRRPGERINTAIK